jgi:hypothetical protein
MVAYEDYAGQNKARSPPRLLSHQSRTPERRNPWSPNKKEKRQKEEAYTYRSPSKKSEWYLHVIGLHTIVLMTVPRKGKTIDRLHTGGGVSGRLPRETSDYSRCFVVALIRDFIDIRYSV